MLNLVRLVPCKNGIPCFIVNNDDIAVYFNIGAIEQKDSVGKNALYLLCANDRVVMYTAVFVLCPPEDKVLVM